MLRICFIILVFIIVGCNSNEPPNVVQEEVTYSPSDFQWLELSQLDQLIYEPNYFQPLIFKTEALDSCQKRRVEIYTEVNDEPGYRFGRKLFFICDKGRLKQMKEELFYNHKSIHKRMFNYSYRKNVLVPPVVTNETKPISSIIRQFFGLGANAVEMVGLSDFFYEEVNDSIILKKSLAPNFSLEEVFTSTRNIVQDTLYFGTILNLGRPIDWCERKIKVPYFNWIPTHTNSFDNTTQMPLNSNFLRHGNTVNRSYLYREDGLFVKSIDSVFYENEFLRSRVLSLTYDSLDLPSQVEVFFQNKSGEKNRHRKHTIEWVK